MMMNATRRSAAVLSRSVAGGARRWASDAPAVAAAKPAQTAVAAPLPSQAAAAAAAPKQKPKSSLSDRLGAFVAGCAATSLTGYYLLHQDVTESTNEIEVVLLEVKRELGDTNTEFRRRIATLEHELAELKRKK